jgi:hypothetical protein
MFYNHKKNPPKIKNSGGFQNDLYEFSLFRSNHLKTKI